MSEYCQKCLCLPQGKSVFQKWSAGLWLEIPVWISSALENSENQDRILYEKCIE